jgi:hypothetical protein
MKELEGKKRVVIEHISPQIGSGRFPSNGASARS